MLNATRIAALKPAAKIKKYGDSGGLYLWIYPNGSRLWRFKYFFEGREKSLALGALAETPLAIARVKRDAARKLLAAGTDPSAARQATVEARGDTVRAITEEWLVKYQKTVEPATYGRTKDRFEKWVFPRIGTRPIRSVLSFDVLKALQVIEDRGLIDTAHRMSAELSRVWCYAVATQRVDADVTLSLKGALPPNKKKHFAAITNPAQVGEMMRAIHGFNGQPVTEIALKLTPHVFLRPTELRAAPWSEIDFEAREWRIPKERMKMRIEHVVPLSTQVLALLRELHQHTGTQTLMFPTSADPTRSMSENTINACLRRIGYEKEQQSAHGFRTTASTLLSELGFHDDIIELQLSHVVGGVKGDYKMAVKLDDRRKMMQAWSDHLDKLRAPPRKRQGDNVIDFPAQQSA